MTICRHHGTRLIDRCGNCQGPILLHRGEQGQPTSFDAALQTRCGNCSHDLVRDARVHQIDKNLLAVQRQLLTWTDSGFAIIGKTKVSSLHLFEIARALCRVAVNYNLGNAQASRAYRRFEMLSVDERAEVLYTAQPYLLDISSALNRVCADRCLRVSDVTWMSSGSVNAFQIVREAAFSDGDRAG